MKPNRLYTALVIITFASCLISCKKESTAAVTDDTDYETTFELSSNQAIADNLTEDANNVFMEAASDKNLLGSNFANQPVETSNILACATVTVTPASGFPKTIIIDFGAGNCTSPNGIIRRGKINIVLSDSVRKNGSKAVMTFVNYYANNFKKEGTVTWTNTSIPSTRSWQRKVENGKVVAPDGRYWMHSGTRDVVQIAGANTPNTLLDDNFLITGNHKVTNAAGKTRDCFITEALQKKTICDNIGTGKLKVQGDNHNAVIDFGNGDCDRLATISIDGQAPRTIVLR
ncbi:hypothetical protein [Ferruginibacter sp.]|nr:hypothetical protein [Ferruginibacter sp.]